MKKWTVKQTWSHISYHTSIPTIATQKKYQTRVFKLCMDCAHAYYNIHNNIERFSLALVIFLQPKHQNSYLLLLLFNRWNSVFLLWKKNPALAPLGFYSFTLSHTSFALICETIHPWGGNFLFPYNKYSYIQCISSALLNVGKRIVQEKQAAFHATCAKMK